ncbi:MAG TPA: hypothetical protein VK694_00575 [Verrucomicrobiae bacterium]|nr:hypothetical protein [Verrucomicrobiae bacterium]
MNDKQWERSNYQVAFLAAVIGLGAFKEELAGWHLGIFSVDLPWIFVFLPLVGLLLMGAFLGAFTVTIIDGLNITRFPLSGLVMRLASLCNILACMWPVLLFLAWGSQGLMWLLRRALGGADASVAWLDVIGSVLSLVLAIISYKITTRLLRQSPIGARSPLGATQDTAPNMGGPEQTLLARRQAVPQDYVFIDYYNTAAQYMQDYLRLRGFGVRNLRLDDLWL